MTKTYDERESLAFRRRLAETAVDLVMRDGTSETIDGLSVRILKRNQLIIAHISRESLPGGEPSHSVNIDVDDCRVFSAHLDPIEVVLFTEGDWVFELLPGIAPSGASAALAELRQQAERLRGSPVTTIDEARRRLDREKDRLAPDKERKK